MNKDDNIIPFAFKRFQERRRSDGMEITPPEKTKSADIDPVSTRFRRETDPIEEIRAFTDARVKMAEARAQAAEIELRSRPEHISAQEHIAYYVAIVFGLALILGFNIGMIK